MAVCPGCGSNDIKVERVVPSTSSKITVRKFKGYCNSCKFSWDSNSREFEECGGNKKKLNASLASRSSVRKPSFSLPSFNFDFSFAGGLFKGVLRIIGIILIIVFVGGALTAIVNYSKNYKVPENMNLVSVPIDSSSVEGMDYREVEKAFKEKGFNSVEFEKIDDLITGWVTKDGSVERVTVNGDYSFKVGDKYDKNTKIIVKYHTFPEKTAEEETSLDNTSKPASEVADSVEPNTDSNSEDLDTGTGEVGNDNQDDAEIVHEKTPRELLDEKLDNYYAWRAVEKYGKLYFPYGFKVHNVLGIIAEEVWDEDTWYLKSECTITNEYGAKLDTVCEALVSGTTDNCIVKDFYVSQY